MKQKFILNLIFWTLLFFHSTNYGISICPSILQQADQLSYQLNYLNGMSLCDFFTNHSTLMEKLKLINKNSSSNQFNPNRVIDLISPRLIDLNKWERDKQRFYYFNPAKVYKPYPDTWNNWLSAVESVETIAKENFTKGQVDPINLGFIRALHRKILHNINSSAGAFRNETEYGHNLDNPLTGKEILTLINKSTFPESLNKDKPLLRWETTKCHFDQPKVLRDRFDKEAKEGLFQFHPEEWIKQNSEPITENSRECGVIVYPPHQELGQQMRLWSLSLNRSIDNWNSNDGKLIENPILTIAKDQRWFIALHPFMDGNGRPSRLIMDLLLQSIGLPPAILEDKDKDLFSTDEEWAYEIGKGLLKNLEILKFCISNPIYPGCQQIEDANNSTQ